MKVPFMSRKPTDQMIESQQNTDPSDDPGDAVATGVADAPRGVDAEVSPDNGPSQEGFETLKAERDQLFDRLARLQAEFDNARKRESRERADFRDYAVSNTVEQFLPVLDNFQLALK